MSGDTFAIILLSMKVALAATLVSLPVAFAVAWLLARYEFRGKALFQAIITLPLVVPPVVTGYLLLILFGTRGAIGGWLNDWFGIVLAFRWTGAALAAGIMAFPLLVRPIRLSIESVDRGLEDAARTLGASGPMTFLAVSLPLVLPGVLAGTILAFAKALGEFGATITFVSNIPGETQTISLAVYSLLQSPAGDREALRLILASVLIAILAVLVSEWLARRMMPERGN